MSGSSWVSLICGTTACILFILLVRSWRKNKSLGPGELIELLGICLSLLIALNPQWIPSKKTPLQEAIRIDYGYAASAGAHMIINFDPQKERDYYLKEHQDLLVPISPIVYLDVVSQVDDEWIKLAPYLVVQIVEVSELNDYVDTYQPSAGAADSPDYFRGFLSPAQEALFGAPLHDAGPNSSLREQLEPVGYFTLQVGEREVFELHMNMLPGYHYVFQVGVLYTYKGETAIKWIQENFVAAQPIKQRVWTPEFQGTGFLFEQEYEYASFGPFSSADDFHTAMREDQTQIKAVQSFILPTPIRKDSQRFEVTATIAGDIVNCGAATVSTTDGAPLRVRETPSLSGAILLRLSPGTSVTLLCQEVEADGYHWLQLRVKGIEGWSIRDALIR